MNFIGYQMFIFPIMLLWIADHWPDDLFRSPASQLNHSIHSTLPEAKLWKTLSPISVRISQSLGNLTIIVGEQCSREILVFGLQKNKKYEKHEY